MNQEKLKLPIIKDDEIDFMAVAMAIWLKRMIIIKTTGLFLILGLLIAVFSHNEYTTTVKLMPESTKTPNLGALGGLASQFGLGALSMPLEGDNIPSEYYPDIIESVPFIKNLMTYQVLIPEAGGMITLFQYYSDYRGTLIPSKIKKYSIGLPHLILGKLKGKATGLEEDESIIRLSKQEWAVYRELVENISVFIDKKTKIVVLEVTMPKDYLAAKVAERVTEMLVEYVKDYKTEKIRNDLEFIEVQLKDSEKRFGKAQELLAQYRDHNQGHMTQVARTTAQRLESDYELAFKIYSAMAQKFDETRIKLQEQTPVVKILEPASVPEKKSSPKRSIIMIVSLILGIVFGVTIIFGQIFWNNFRTQFKKNKATNTLVE